MRVRMIAVVSMAGIASAQVDDGACCAYGGIGAATASGMGTIALPFWANNASTVEPFTLAASGNTDNPFVAVVIKPNPGIEESLAGWYIKSDGQNQVMYRWFNYDHDGNWPSATPTCTKDIAYAGQYTAGYSLCSGDLRGALFPVFAMQYQLGAVVANAFATVESNSTSGAAHMSFTDGKYGCAPIALIMSAIPLGSGAASVTFLEGASAAPQWLPPSYCNSGLN